MRILGPGLAVAAAVAASGCGLIAGLEDHRLAPAGGGGSGSASSGAGVGGAPVGDGVPIATGQSFPHALALDETTVYWVTEGVGARGVWRAPKEGGDPVQLASLPDPNVSEPATIPIGIALDVDNVYWTQDNGNGNCDPTSFFYRGHFVMQRLKDGSEPKMRMWEGCDNSHPNGIAADAQNLYFAARGYHDIRRVRKSSLVDDRLARDQYSPIAVAANKTEVFWTVQENNLGIIRKAPKTATDAYPPDIFWVDDQLRQPNALAVDDENIYWVDDGQVRMIQKDSDINTMPTTLASGGGVFSAIAIDDTHVYWANATEGTILRVAKTGGDPEQVTTGQGDPEGIAVDLTAIYWTNAASGEVMRLEKPTGP